ncbi:MAG: TauD/TfdA family dioxygenase [Gammaproteobacteria bacterium]|nr:TauD/TfdA family dioxygenase [Gammaproteobacteria bacterium]
MLDFETDYSKWRESKLAHRTIQTQLQPVAIQNPASLSQQELESLSKQCQHDNFAIYSLQQPSLANKASIRKMADQIGMSALDQNLCADNDSISSIKVMDLGRARGYIPYTANALNWHTDGYYNAIHEHIRSFLLHCIQNAPSGGENMLINHELIYIQLHDKNPDLVAALMQPDALRIPANIENGQQVRPAQIGPVFYRDSSSNTLQMRYTSRSRSIDWKQDSRVQQAVSMIEELLTDSVFVIHYILQPGEGLICNNILHGRSAFTNGNIPQKQRVMYRARSFNRLFNGQ